MAELAKINIDGLDAEFHDNSYKMFSMCSCTIESKEEKAVDFNYNIKKNSDKIKIFAESLIPGLFVKRIENSEVVIINLSDQDVVIKENTLFVHIFITLPIKTTIVLETFDMVIVEVPKDPEVWFIRNYVNNKMLVKLHDKVLTNAMHNKYAEAELVYKKIGTHFKNFYKNRFDCAVKIILSVAS